MSAPPPAQPWATRPLADLLDVVASRSAPVGGGSAAAVVAAVAAALVERCAAEAGNEESRARAEAARTTLADLVDIDSAALVALMQALDADDETAALVAEAASAPVTRLRGIARELAGLAEQIGRDGRAFLRGEARGAHLFAGAAARAADEIIAINERSMRPDPGPDGDDDAVAAVDLAHAGRGSGPRWGMQSEELNATLLAWPAGHEIAAHINTERDVLMVVLEGSARATVDEVDHQLAADQLLLIPRGCVRAIIAGPGGVRYLSTHCRRGPLLPTARATR